MLEVQANAAAAIHNAKRAADSRPFPDVILRSQFFETIGKRTLTSEQRLMLAVLADAINILQDGYRSASARKRSSFADARNWMFQGSKACPLSFEGVCEALGIDAEALKWRMSTLISGTPDPNYSPLRLRLKEASRVQRLTVNRVRRRDRRARLRPRRA
jgi:hypothetical protein